MKKHLLSFLYGILIATSAQAYQITLPNAGVPYLIANQLDCAGGNTLVNVFGNQLPDFTQVMFWKCCSDDPTNLAQLTASTNWEVYIYDSTQPVSGYDWYQNDDATPVDANNIYLNPGQGVFVIPAAPVTLNFAGTAHIPVFPITLPCGCGHWNLLSRQTDDVGTYENVTGQAPTEGSQVARWNGNTATFTIYSFSGGVWSESEPALGVGEAAFFLVPCSTNCISMTCFTNKTVPCNTNWDFDAPTNIVDNCCSNYYVTFTTVTNSEPCPWVFTRTWTVSDDCSNSATCSQQVTVVNTNPTVIWCPFNIEVISCVATQIYYSATASNLCCSNLLVTCNPPSGATFLPGTTNTVSCTTTDCCGNVTGCSFTVTVQCNSGCTITNSISGPNIYHFLGDPVLTAPTSLGVLFPNTDGRYDMDVVYIYDCSGTNACYMFDSGSPSGFDDCDLNPVPAPMINPGQGFLFVNAGATFNWVISGTPGTPVLPPPNYCECNKFSLLCEQSCSLPGTYQNITGYAPQEGAKEKIWNPTTFEFDIYTFTGGAWTPSTPRDLNAGEAAFFLVPCPTNCISMTCSNIVIIACTNVAVNFSNLVSASDNCCSNVTITFDPPSGSVFAPGTTTWITCTATDCCTNSTDCSFSVTVQRPPCCQVFNTGMSGPNGDVPVDGGLPDPNYLLVSSPPGEGTTAVVTANLPPNWLPNTSSSKWIASGTDTSSSAAGTYHYQLHFTLCCSNAQLVGRMAADNSALIYLNNNLVGTVANFWTWTPINLGAGFVFGNNVLDIYTTNADNFSYNGFRAELTVCQKPLTLTCASNKVVQCGQQWTFDQPTVLTPCCTNIIGPWLDSSNLLSAGPCPVIYQGIWEAMDSCCSNIATCTQTVTVVDLEAPHLYCPSNFVVIACTNVAVNFSNLVSASDNCCSNVTITFDPPSGSVFAPGTTTWIICTATDCCTNATNCSFSVTVQRPPCCQVFNTGMSGPNGDVPVAGGLPDPNYLLVSSPSGAGTTAMVTVTMPTSWLTNTSSSKWIASGTNTLNSPAGIYHYQLHFTLCCSNALLTGRMAADNSAWVYLNNNLVSTVDGFASWTAINVGGGFVVGDNMLDILVTNIDLWNGLRAELTVCQKPLTLTCADDKTVECGQSWTFDPPSVYAPCCTNVTGPWLASSNLISGNPPCQEVWQGVWFAMDCCSNISTCTQTVSVVDTTPPIFNSICVTNVFMAGTNDNFVGPEPASPSPGLTNRLRTQYNAQFKNFDDCTENEWVAHTFTNLPPCNIVAATLTLHVKPCAGQPANDSVSLSFTGSDGVLLTTNGYWGSLLGSPGGLLPNAWNTTSYPTGAIITLNLADLSPGGLNLLPYLNAYGFLDFTCQDDSSVDYMELTVVSCCCASNKTVECGDAWNFDQPIAWDQCCGTNVTVWLASSNLISGSPPCQEVWQGIWYAVDCCTNISTCTQTVTVVDTQAPTFTYCPTNKAVECGTNWTFDQPSAWDQCCETNVTLWLASSNLISGNPPCQEVWQGVWYAMDCCTNISTCTQTVTVVDTQPPVFATYCVTNILAVGGTNDNFTMPEPAFPSAGLVARLQALGGSGIMKGFDICSNNTYCAHTFSNLPACIVSARLTVRVKPCPNADNCQTDTLGLYFTDPAGNALGESWERYLGADPATRPMVPGLLTNNWCDYTEGYVFEFDLAALPLINGEVNLLPFLRQYGFLDFVLQDDSAVDYVVLTYTCCCCASNKTVECGTNWTFDQPSAWDQCCGTNVTIWLASSNLISGNPPCWAVWQGIWNAMDCCSNISTCTQTVTVVDTTAPTFTYCPTNKTVECGTNWTFDQPSAWDQCCGTNVTVWLVSSNLISGNPPCQEVWQGVWYAMDCCSNFATCTQTVTVVDSAPPIFTTAVVASTFDSDWDGWTATTTGEVTWQSSGGNPGGYLQYVDALTGPTWIIAPDKFKGNWLCYTAISWDDKMFTAADYFQPQVTITGGPLNESVTWWPDSATGPTDWLHLVMPLQGAIDWNHMSIKDPVALNRILGNVTDVRILIDANPNISNDTEGVDNVVLTGSCGNCLTNINKAVQCGNAWSFDRPAAWDACCGTNVTLWLASSNCISTGPCPVVWMGIWEAMDCCSNISTCTQTVTVVDLVAPQIYCPSNIVVTSCTNVAANYSNLVTAVDDCCSNVTVTFDPPSGSVFAPGTTNTVYCTATDCCTNTATNTFTVTVLKRQAIAGLFNTGGAPGGTDAHYVLLVNPSGTGSQARVVTNSVILDVWLTNSTDSQWIGAQTDGSGVSPANYEYRLAFNLCCTNDVIITGRWAADDGGVIKLNNSPIADPNGNLPANGWNNLTNWHSFTITSGFLPGQNTLDFWVTNAEAYTGLRVELSGSSACCSNLETFSGVKFNDVNHDGIWEEAIEPVLTNWTIYAVDVVSGITVTSVQTDTNGDYQLVLPCGTYLIQEVLQAGWSNSCPSNGYYIVNVGTGQNIGLNFGNYVVSIPMPTPGPISYCNSIPTFVISYPSNPVPWSVQWTTNLNNGMWWPLTNPAYICNGWYNLSVPMTLPDEYFRLATTNPGVIHKP